MLGIKQEALALELGDDWNQREISLLEQKEVIESELLEAIAKALKVPVEAIRNFDEEKAFNIIGNTYHDQAASVYYNFNPIDKMVELYDKLLKEKDEKIVLLEKMLIYKQ
jgi:transcriptional regulator with XRE-family HTH domain